MRTNPPLQAKLLLTFLLLLTTSWIPSPVRAYEGCWNRIYYEYRGFLETLPSHSQWHYNTTRGSGDLWTINLTISGTGEPPITAKSELPVSLGVQYDFNAFYVGIRVDNITIVGDGFTLFLHISVDDGVFKEWNPTYHYYARGDSHSFQIFRKNSYWSYDNLFVGNSTSGWSYRNSNAIPLEDTGESFNFTAQGIPLELGNFSLETTFAFNPEHWRPSLAVASPYRFRVSLIQHFYWEIDTDIWEYYDIDYYWPQNSFLPGLDEYFPESIFANWTRVVCPALVPIPPLPIEIMILIVIFGVVGATALVIGKSIHRKHRA